MLASYYRHSTTLSLTTMSLVMINTAMIISILLAPGLTFAEALEGTGAQRFGGYVSIVLFGFSLAYLIGGILRLFDIGAPKEGSLERTRSTVLGVALLASLIGSQVAFPTMNLLGIGFIAIQLLMAFLLIYGALRSSRTPKEGTPEAP